MIHPDALSIIFAVTLDFAIGDPRWLPHPVVLIGSLIAYLESFLRRSWFSERTAGIILLLLVVSISASITWLLIYIITVFLPLLGWIVAVIISSTCLAARSLHKEAGLVVSALLSGNINSARLYLSYIVGRDTKDLEESEIWRAVIETVAENTSDGIIAPLFWLTIGGPVAAMGFKAVSTLDSMVGYKNEQYIQFGWASARMDDLLNFIPARISALLIILASPFVDCSFRGATKIALRDRFNHPSPNSGHPEAAVAGALGVRLGGAATYKGIYSWKEYIGESLNPLDESAYHAMIKLMYISTMFMVAICVALLFSLRGLYVSLI